MSFLVLFGDAVARGFERIPGWVRGVVLALIVLQVVRVTTLKRSADDDGEPRDRSYPVDSSRDGPRGPDATGVDTSSGQVRSRLEICRSYHSRSEPASP